MEAALDIGARRNALFNNDSSIAISPIEGKKAFGPSHCESAPIQGLQLSFLGPQRIIGLGPWTVELMIVTSGHDGRRLFDEQCRRIRAKRAFSGSVSDGLHSIPDLARPARFRLGLAHQHRHEFCWIFDTKDIGLAPHNPEIPRGKVGEIATCAGQVKAKE